MSRPEIERVDADSRSEAAARWFAQRRQGPDWPGEHEFQAWLEASADNRRAYDEVIRSWEIAGDCASDARIVTMRSEALMLRPEPMSAPPRERTRLWGALATAAMLVLVVGGVLITNPDLVDQTRVPAERDNVILRTGVGQMATAALADGSSVTLNTNSIVQIDYSAARRGVRLISGQVLFKVAKDASRPFVVAAGDRQIIALGTQFEVRLDEGRKVRVALLEGRVRVQPISEPVVVQGRLVADASAPVLSPGQQLLVSASGDVLVKSADVANLVSWKTGRVRFDDVRLADAVAEMNRYSRTRIIFDDQTVANIRISGAFRTGQSRSFAETLSEAFPVKAEQKGETIRLVSAG